MFLKIFQSHSVEKQNGVSLGLKEAFFWLKYAKKLFCMNPESWEVSSKSNLRAEKGFLLTENIKEIERGLHCEMSNFQNKCRTVPKMNRHIAFNLKCICSKKEWRTFWIILAFRRICLTTSTWKLALTSIRVESFSWKFQACFLTRVTDR